ncbi:hypothetical protein PsYK624_105410 [Phanerochaete sordida]|uniref:Uncharacterized protein n=1 Tax=Phanerochaete sordida TaxID=48140 RepID=A0A9P3GET3_9APHY|nr:hypothetical protein PsYK624_105410 [Phanerochaete sordida]
MSDTPSLPAYIPILLNPGLQSFAIRETDHNIVCAVLGDLFDQCPDLHSLSVDAWNADSLAFIPRFKKLQQLMTLDFRLSSPASTTIMSSLAMSPFLRQLAIHAPSSLAVIPRIPDVPTFPSLVYLSIDVITDVLVVNALLRLVPAQSLATLVISFEDPSELSNTGHMKTLLNTISTFRRLKELKITQSSDTESSIPSWDLDPLLQLTSLEHLFINVPGYSLPRDFFRRRPDSPWPRLKDMGLQNPDMLPPIDILGDFAHYLPNLARLTMPFDAVDDPASPVPLGQSTAPVQLCVDGSPILEPCCPTVAAYIALAYPNASLIYDDDYEGMDVEDERIDHARCWNKVLEMFPVMVAVADAQRTLIRDGKVDMKPERLVSDEN